MDVKNSAFYPHRISRRRFMRRLGGGAVATPAVAGSVVSPAAQRYRSERVEIACLQPTPHRIATPMYTALLIVHSYLRWLVLIAALVVVARAVAGMVAGRAWTSRDDTVVRVFSISLDIQMLIGLIIYFFLSPFTYPAWSDLAATMRDDAVRFIVIEHQTGMLIAVALTHVGVTRVRRNANPARRHRTALIFFGLALVMMLASIPWPGMPAGRPLFRGVSIGQGSG